jgi:hypothetical protein
MSESEMESGLAQADNHEFQRVGTDAEAAKRSMSAGDEDSLGTEAPVDAIGENNKKDFASEGASKGEQTSKDEVPPAVPDPNIVDWDGPEDPENPRNWSKAKKMLNISLISLSVLYTYVWINVFPVRAKSMLHATRKITIY